MRLLITAAFAAALYLILCYMTSRSVFYPFRYPQGFARIVGVEPK